MKKSLSLLAAGMLLAGSANATTWGVCGTFNGWDGDVFMDEIAENVYSVTMESLQGEFKFRADSGWDLNFGCEKAVNIIGNTVIPMVANGSNFNLPEEAKDITLTIDTANLTLKVTGMSNDMNFETLYLIGDPAGDWTTDAGILMDNVSDGVFSWTGELLENQYISFAKALVPDNDWELFNANRYSPAQDGAELAIDEPNEIVFGKDGAWRVTENGRFTLTVNTNDLTLTATKEKVEWSVIGAFNDWSDDVMMTEVSSGVYTVTMDSLEGEFKFRQNRSWDADFGAYWGEGAISANGTYYLLEAGENFYFTQPQENVSLTIDIYAKTLTVSTESGINTLGSDNGEATYFNLQGIKTVNPQHGVYIRVTNGKTEKIAVK